MREEAAVVVTKAQAPTEDAETRSTVEAQVFLWRYREALCRELTDAEATTVRQHQGMVDEANGYAILPAFGRRVDLSQEQLRSIAIQRVVQNAPWTTGGQLVEIKYQK